MSMDIKQPRFGDFYTDFHEKYGPPWRPAGPQKNFWIDKEQGIWVSVRSESTQNRVNYLAVMGDASWSQEQTETFAAQFLPSDAQEFNRVTTAIGVLINYHSRVGDMIMRVRGQGVCTLNGAILTLNVK